MDLMTAVQRFFDGEDWGYDEIEDMSMLELEFEGENGKWTCYAEARDEISVFIFYSVCPDTCPPERLTAMAEFLHRASYGMGMGNFELDYDDGEIRLKTSNDFHDHRPKQDIFKRLVYYNTFTMDQYLPALQAVMQGTAPVDALETLED